MPMATLGAMTDTYAIWVGNVPGHYTASYFACCVCRQSFLQKRMLVKMHRMITARAPEYIDVLEIVLFCTAAFRHVLED